MRKSHGAQRGMAARIDDRANRLNGAPSMAIGGGAMGEREGKENGCEKPPN